MKMVLTNIYEEVVDPNFHSVIRGLSTKGFVTTPPVDILENLQYLYGKPIFQELDATLLRLNDPMNRMKPVEVMLRVIEEVQLFLLSKPDKYIALTEPNPIIYALIKLTNTRGMYSKGIEKWHERPLQDRRKWAELSAHMVKYYERIPPKRG